MGTKITPVTIVIECILNTQFGAFDLFNTMAKEIVVQCLGGNMCCFEPSDPLKHSIAENVQSCFIICAIVFIAQGRYNEINKSLIPTSTAALLGVNNGIGRSKVSWPDPVACMQ